MEKPEEEEEEEEVLEKQKEGDIENWQLKSTVQTNLWSKE